MHGQPHPAYAAARPKKSSVGAVLMAIGGAVILFITFISWLGLAHGGFGVAFMCGLFAAAAFALLVHGAMGGAAAKKKLIASGVGGGVLAVVFTVAGPAVSSGFEASTERRHFRELEASTDDPAFDFAKWHADYSIVDKKFRREGWEGAWMLARVEHSAAARDVAELRSILGEIAGQSSSDYSEAEEAAASFLKGVYAEAIKKLSAPAKSKDSPVDDKLRAGFVTVLDAFVASPDANLYLAFEQKVDLTAPDGDADILAQLRQLPELKAAFPKGAPVIAEGEAFLPKYDTRRRNMFVRAMTDAFHKIFDDQLLHLVPLDKGESRKGKQVLEVRSAIRRIPIYGTYYQFNAAGQKVTKGLTFEFVVVWSFKLVDAKGKVIYQAKEIETQAAPDVSLGDGQAVPQWAIYGALMDSAYYNYSRDVIARFGLQPPPERSVFPFNAVSSN